MKQKNFPCKKLFLSIIISSSLVTTQVHASGIKDAINSMYLSAATNPTAIATLHANGYYLGRLTLKPVGKTAAVIQFAPPRISAGCGGIDIFFGAFSFINAQQFEQFIRAIIAAAPSFLLKMAIRSMCDPCGVVLDKLEEIANTVNQFMRSSCEIAGALFSADPTEKERYENHVKGMWSRFESAVGGLADALAGKAYASAKPTPETANEIAEPASSSGGDNKTLTLAGDIACKAYELNKEKIKNLSSYFGDAFTKRLVISLTGTAFFPVDTNGQSCPNGTAEGNCIAPPQVVAPTIETIEAFFKDRETGGELKILAPVDDCMKQPGETTEATWRGLRHYLREVFFGGDAPIGANGKANDGTIVAYALRGGSINNKALSILKDYGQNLILLIREAERANGEAFAVTIADHYVTKIIEPQMRYHIASQIINMITTMYDNRTGGNEINSDKLAFLRDRRNVLYNELSSTIYPAYNRLSLITEINEITQAVKNVQQMNSQY